jgi:hypothetical protein
MDYKLVILSFVLPIIIKIGRGIMGSGFTGSAFKQRQKTKMGFRKWIRIKLRLDPPQNVYQYSDNKVNIQTNSEIDFEELMKRHKQIMEDQNRFVNVYNNSLWHDSPFDLDNK